MKKTKSLFFSLLILILMLTMSMGALATENPDEISTLINVAPSSLNLTATDAAAQAITLTDKGVVDGYHQYEYRGAAQKCTFSAMEAEKNWGSVTLKLSSEKESITLRGTEFYCNTKADNKYLSASDYKIKIKDPAGVKTTAGDAYVSDDSGQTRNRYIMFADGNNSVYDYVYEPTKYDSGFSIGQAVNQRVDANTKLNTVSFNLTNGIIGTFTVPKNAELKVELQVQNYKNVIVETFKKEENLFSDTFTYALPKSNSNLIYYCSMEDKVTKAGYLNTKTADFAKNITFSSEAPSVRPKYAANSYVEDNILLNINDSNYLTLNQGDTFKIKAFRAAWQIVNSLTANVMIEPDFHYNVVEGNSVKVDGEGLLTAIAPGVSIVEVTYDAIDVEDDLLYGAVEPCRKGMFVVNVGGDNASSIDTGIKLTEFDTVYFQDKAGSYTFTPKADKDLTIKVNDQAVRANDNGSYTVDLNDGNNIVEVSDGNAVKYHVIKAKKINVNIKNATDPNSDTFKVGDTVNISFDGLNMPVPKMGGIYNPGYQGTIKALYDLEGGGTVSSKGTQYNFIKSHTISFTLNRAGTYELVNGRIPLTSMGDTFGNHRSIDDRGRTVNMTALERTGVFCALPDITLDVTPNNDFELPDNFNVLSKMQLFLGIDSWTNVFSSTAKAENNIISFTKSIGDNSLKVNATPAQNETDLKLVVRSGSAESKTFQITSGITEDLGTGLVDKDKINYFDLVVTPLTEDYGNAKTYSYMAYNSNNVKNPGLKNLTIAAATEGVSLGTGEGILKSDAGQGFRLSRNAYTAKVGYDVDAITLTPSKVVPTSVVKVNGIEVTDKTASAPIALNVGENNITVSTTNAEGGETIEYTITATRSKVATLENLRVSGFTPSATNTLLQYSTDNYGDAPKFDKAVTSYDLAAQYDTYSSVYLRGVATIEGSTVKAYAGGKEVTLSSSSSKSVTVATGKNQIRVVVTPPKETDAEEGEYLLNLNVQPSFTRLPLEIDGLALSLNQDFNKTQTEYTANILNSVKTIDIAGAYTKKDCVVKINGETIQHSGTVTTSVNVQSKDKLEIAVTGGVGENTLTTTYVIHLNKVAPSTLKINAEPADATIKVFDAKGNLLSAEKNGSYIGMFKENNYTYVVSKLGYISNKGAVPKENAVSLKINLEKAKKETISFSAQQGNKFIVPLDKLEVFPGLAEIYGYAYGKNVKATDITTLDALVAAHIAYFGNEFTEKTAKNLLDVDANSGMIRKMFDISSNALSFAVNGLYPHDDVLVGNSYTGYTVNEAVIQQDDTVEFFFYQDSGYSDLYAWFEQNGKKVTNFTVDKGDKVDLTLKGYNFTYYGYASDEMREAMTDTIPNASIGTVNAKNGRFVPMDGAITSAESSNKGKVTVTFDKAGSYVLSAKGEGSNYIISPWCTITVTDVVQDVVNLIHALPEKVTLDSRAAIEKARSAYNALSSTKQNQVPKTSLTLLEEKETALAGIMYPGAEGFVTISIEKFTLGQGYIVEPTFVPFYKGDNAAMLLTRVLGEENYKNTGSVDNGFYLSSVKDEDTSGVNIPQFILDMAGSPTDGKNTEGWLGEFDYYNMSGWMFSQNNEFPAVGSSDCPLENGDVIRWQFTVYGFGEDVRIDAYAADKGELTTAIAKVNGAEDKALLLASPENKAVYDAAIATLSNMQSTQKQVDDACAAVKELKVEDNAIIALVEDLINKLPDASKITLGDKPSVENGCKAYDALTEKQKALFNKTVLEKLVDAEEAIASLEKDSQVAAVVTEQIKSLPNADKITLADKKAVEKAKANYDALTEKQKALVPQDVLEKLTAVQAKITALEANSTTANTVTEKINALPHLDDLTLKDAAVVSEVRAAYDSLSEEQKSFVSANTLQKLLNAEAKIAELKKEEKPPVNIEDFSDIKTEDWFYNDVDYVVSNGLMVGTTSTAFGAKENMTRGQFVTVLGRHADVKSVVPTKTQFADVNPNAYYAPYVNWAVEKGIVSGYNATTFGPEDPITREQMATIMWNDLKVADMTLPTGDTQKFADDHLISAWAKDAIYGMKAMSVIVGKENNNFDPQGKTIRAEVAAVLHRFIETTENK